MAAESSTKGFEQASVAILVTLYHPDEPLLSKLLPLLAGCQKILLLDNTPHSESLSSTEAKIEHIRFGRNTGLAHALNFGMQRARDLGVDYVILLDQDSHLTPELFHELVSRVQGHAGHVVAPRLSGVQKWSESIRSPRAREIQMTELPTSGITLRLSDIPHDVLFNEDLFLDFVDFEWCWQLGRRGVRFFQQQNICMGHALGLGSIKVIGLPFNVPHSYRHYLQFRDSLYLAKRRYVPLYQRFRLISILFIKLVLYPLILEEGSSRLRWMIRGIRDHLRGVSGIGALDQESSLH